MADQNAFRNSLARTFRVRVIMQQLAVAGEPTREKQPVESVPTLKLRQVRLSKAVHWLVQVRPMHHEPMDDANLKKSHSRGTMLQLRQVGRLVEGHSSIKALLCRAMNETAATSNGSVAYLKRRAAVGRSSVTPSISRQPSVFLHLLRTQLSRWWQRWGLQPSVQRMAAWYQRVPSFERVKL